MSEIKIVDGTYALVDADRVIGSVSRINETQWGFHPLVPGVCHAGVSDYVPLRYALDAALKFKPS